MDLFTEFTNTFSDVISSFTDIFHYVAVPFGYAVAFIKSLTLTEVIFGTLVILYLVSGLDDLLFDIVYWIVYGIRRVLFPRKFYPLLNEDQLNSTPQGKAAIFIAAWHEDDVIDKMLLHNTKLIDYQNYDFFIGTYPNDPATQEKVDLVRERLPNVYKAINPKPGPTCKADNLNSIYAELLKQEQISGKRYEFILMHDPEDVLHPMELKLGNYLLRREDIDMVQTPVFPLEVPAHYFTAGTYADEFAEVHSKDMYVREWVGGFVPSAGVGTAISRKVFARFKNRFGDNFFNPNTLTEDYDFSLRLRLAGLRAIFVRQPILRRKSVRTFFGKEKIKWVKEFIVTRAHFPHTFKTAVRQRTRWSLGIIFQGWKTIGWKGELQVLWMLFHDRKGAWTNSTLLFGYLFTLYLIISELLRATIRPDLPTVLPDHEWINWAVYICAGLMINRLLQRVIATSRIYNLWQGFLAAPRMIWGNVINAFATIRAAKQFFNAERKGTKIAWDKTKHYFPSAPELPLRQQNASSNIN